MRNKAAHVKNTQCEDLVRLGVIFLRNLDERLWPFSFSQWGQKGRVDFEALFFVEVMLLKAGNIER